MTVSRRSERGAAAVEFAVLLPVLVLLVYAVIEFGIIFAQDLALGNGAREGGRFGSSTPNLLCYDSDNSEQPTDLIEFVRTASETTLLGGSTLENEVQITVSTVDASGTPTVRCAAGPDLVVEEDANATCGFDDADRVVVESTYERGISIPFGPVASDFQVNGTGVFTCEY